MAVKQRTEFLVSVPNRPGELGRVLESLAKGKVNVLGVCGWGEGETAKVMVVPDNDAKARKALAGGGFSFAEGPVIAVTGASGVGTGAKLAGKLAAAGLNVDHVYASTSGRGSGAVMLRVTDPQAALKALGGK